MAYLKAGSFRNKCRAVLFDKDGTLIDFNNMWLTWLEYLLTTLVKKHQLTEKVISEFEVAIGVDLTRRCIDPKGLMVTGKFDELRNSIALCMSRYGIEQEKARESFNSVVIAGEDALDWQGLTKPVPGLEGVLKKLKAETIKMAVVTADTTLRAQKSLSYLGITSYFETIIGADMVKETKPAPDMAFLACELLEVDPNEAVVIGDNILDMYMGKDAGLAGSIGVLTGVCQKEQLEKVADAVVNSVADIDIDNI